MELEIGEHAGLVWHALKSNGSQSPTTLGRTLELKRDEVERAIGWLAREGKLQIKSNGTGWVKVCLK